MLNLLSFSILLLAAVNVGNLLLGAIGPSSHPPAVRVARRTLETAGASAA